MIHALLFVTMRYDNHDGHGPEFLREAERINKLAGTNITVYHKYVLLASQIAHIKAVCDTIL